MKKIILNTLIIVSIPFLIINYFFCYKENNIISGFIKNNTKKNNIRVLTRNNNIINLDLEEYLIGVVSAEVPVYFEKEALKAQAVAARTYALKQMENNKDKDYDVTTTVSSQVYQSDEELRNKWQNNYEDNISKIKEAIKNTEGEYISYDGDYIYAFFFSTSNGYTEDNKNVFGKELPYLKMVDSSFDKNETSSFEKTTSFTKRDFYEKLNIEYKDELIISNIIKSESNRILSISINNNEFTGRKVQSLLNLRSNDFNIIDEGENIKIITKGFGHGVGLSQYGANALAKQNKSYVDILKYYYQGTELKKL